MPLLRFDIIEGRSDSEINKLLNASHEAILEAFEVPSRDRYQIVNEHKPSRMIVEDAGLGINRSKDVVLLQVASRPRSKEQKINFFRILADKLEKTCGLSSNDLVVTFLINQDEDWSFGMGRAQFLTGEL
jgi:hypothetical protein